MFFNKTKLNSREIAQFCHQLQMLLGAGIPLLEGLSILKNNRLAKKFGVAEIMRKVSEGEPLSSALGDNFPPMVVISVAHAEKSGSLEETLGNLSRYFESRAETEEKIKSALAYPIFVVLLSVLFSAVLLLVVLPGFKELFLDLGGELPPLTRFIIALSDFMVNFWYLAIGIIGGGAWLLFKKRGDLFFRIPILKQFLIKGQLIQLFRSLGALLNGGAPLVEAIVVSGRSSELEGCLLKIADDIRNGEKLSSALSRHRLFPADSVQIIALAENSGNLGGVFVRLAALYENERETFLKRFTTLLEPSLTLAVGLLVGFIALGMFLPLVGMISSLQ